MWRANRSPYAYASSCINRSNNSIKNHWNGKLKRRHVSTPIHDAHRALKRRRLNDSSRVATTYGAAASSAESPASGAVDSPLASSESNGSSLFVGNVDTPPKSNAELRSGKRHVADLSAPKNGSVQHQLPIS